MDLATLFDSWQISWNWTLGWSLVLTGFSWGAILGLGFQSETYLGGYATFARRLLRLGHVACIALGAANLAWSIGPVAGSTAQWGGVAWAAGGLLMPAVCALTAWRESFRHLFFLPVLALSLGALMGLLS